MKLRIFTKFGMINWSIVYFLLQLNVTVYDFRCLQVNHVIKNDKKFTSENSALQAINILLLVKENPEFRAGARYLNIQLP